MIIFLPQKTQNNNQLIYCYHNIKQWHIIQIIKKPNIFQTYENNENNYLSSLKSQETYRINKTRMIE